MIIGNSNMMEVVGEDVSSTATINLNKIAKLQYILTEGLYSDPESAVIVELSNNGVDSIVDSGKDPLENPVVVSLSSKNGYSLSIQDKGTGMSKDFFENFFMNLLSSTKECSNDFIGSFGLGGKSWASLKRAVTFTIVKDGIKCKYLCYRGEELIDYDLLSEEETQEENGVLFEMPINNYTEYATFTRKATQKLSYYDTVILVVDGQIRENKIYRNELFQYNLASPYPQLHVCLKDVVYSLDYDKLGIHSINLPIAIRLHLDDGVNVTPSRESILYSKHTIDLIKTKIGKVADFFKEKYNDSVKEPISFWENYSHIGSSSKNVTLIDKTFETSCLSAYGVTNFNDFTCESMVLRNPQYYKSNLYTLISGLLVLKAELSWNGSWKTSKMYTNLDSMYSRKNKVCLIGDFLGGHLKEYIKELDKNSKIYVSLHSKKSLIWYKRNILGSTPKEEWRGLIKEWQDVEQLIIRDFCIDHRPIETSKAFLDWVEVKKAWAKANKVSSLSGNKILNKQEGEVTIAYPRKARIGSDYVFEKNVYKVSELYKTKQVVIVFDESEREVAKAWAGIVKREKVAIIGQREFNKIKDIKQFVLFSKFMQDNKPFRRIATAILADKILKDYYVIIGKNIEIVKDCLNNLSEDIKLLKQYKDKNAQYVDSDTTSAILEVATSLNLWDEEILPVIKRMEKNMETFSFIQYIEKPSYGTSEERKRDITKLVNQMLLFRKKYYKQLENYDLVYNPPVVEEVEVEEEVSKMEQLLETI